MLHDRESRRVQYAQGGDIIHLALSLLGATRAPWHTVNMSEFATERDRAAGLIFDWNEVNRKGRILPKNATFFDETLRDGLQNQAATIAKGCFHLGEVGVQVSHYIRRIGRLDPGSETAQVCKKNGDIVMKNLKMIYTYIYI